LKGQEMLTLAEWNRISVPVTRKLLRNAIARRIRHERALARLWGKIPVGTTVRIGLARYP